MKRYSFLIIFSAFLVYSILFFTGILMADTIVMDDAKEIKGIVVEDYQDRVVFSTVDGEVTIMKSDIRRLTYDSEEDNFIKLANLYVDKRNYSKAQYYYDKALEINPDSREAKEGMDFLRGSFLRKEEVMKEEAIRRQKDIELSSGAGKIRSESEEIADMLAMLESSTGMKIAMKNNMPEVLSVKLSSPAYASGVRKGDFIVAVWGKMIGYLPLKDVLTLLLKKTSLEIKCTIERIITIPVKINSNIFMGTEDKIGASFAIRLDGITVSSVRPDSPADMAGVIKNDIVVAIDGNATRYMPLKNFINSIKNINNGAVKLTIRRKVVIWRVPVI